MDKFGIKQIVDHIALRISDPLAKAYVEGKRVEAEAIVKAAELRAEAQHHDAEARISAANVMAP